MRRLKVKLLSQRNPAWASQLLGYNKSEPYTLGNFGCLITCLASQLGKDPVYVNKTLKDNNGFTANGGDFYWGKSTVLGLNQKYLSPKWSGPMPTSQIQKIKEFIDQGYPLLTEVDFNPNTTYEEMHFILICGYDGDNILAMDPWVGEIINLSNYGGSTRAIIQYRVYDLKLPLESETIITNMDTDRANGIKLIDEYRDKRTQGKEGNFEGYINAIIGSDKELPGTKKALDSETAKRTQLEKDLNVAITNLSVKEQAVKSLKDQIETALAAVEKAPTTEVQVVYTNTYKTHLAKVLAKVAEWVDKV